MAPSEHRWLVRLNALLVVLLVIALGGMGYAIHSNAVALSQGCTSDAKRLIDKESQVTQSEAYLKSPLGLDRKGPTAGLNDYIRKVSLPRLRHEIESDRKTFPSSCRDEYRALKHH